MERKGSLWKRQQQQGEQEEESALNILKDFCEDTSWGGLGRVAGSKYLLFRIIWLIAFLAAFGAGIYQLYILFQLYESKPVSTQISLERSTRLIFPTITICNFNMIRKSKLEQLPASIKSQVKQFAQKRNKTRTSKNTNVKDVDGDIPDPSTVSDEYIAIEKLIAALSKEDEAVLAPLGHQLDEMVLRCEFRGVDCTNSTNSKSYWSSYWHYKYGNCYAFNQRHSNDGTTNSPLRTTRPGPSHGLIIEIDTEQNEYIDQLSENAGVVVHISPRGQMPFPFEEGLRMAPGYSTAIGLRMVDIIRVDRFNNNTCVTTAAQSKQNLYGKKFKTFYSTMACLESCMANHQKKDCGCMEYKYYPTDKIVCDTFNKTTVSCLRQLLIKSRKNQLNCTSACPPPCQEQIFRVTSSFSTWPSENYLESLNVNMASNRSAESIRKNLLKLEIFFQDLNYERMQQQISYQIENFVSDIGGQLGLWLGVSVLSGLEVIELISVIFIYFFYEKPRKQNKAQDLNQNGQEGMQMT